MSISEHHAKRSQFSRNCFGNAICRGMRSFQLGFSCHHSPLSAATKAAVPTAEVAEVSACHQVLQISGQDINHGIN